LRNRKTLLAGLTFIIGLTLLVQSVSMVNSIPQLNTLICYMDYGDIEPDVGDQLNVTVVFKNYLDEANPLENVSMTMEPREEDEPGLNITNVNNVPYENPSYNQTTIFSTGTNSTPFFNWNHTYVEISWARFEVNLTQTFWFVIDCVIEGNFRINNPEFTFKLNNETETFTGAGFGITVRGEENETAILSPVRGDWEWYWWFSGALLIVAPLIVIIITRLTLWKR